MYVMTTAFILVLNICLVVSFPLCASKKEATKIQLLSDFIPKDNVANKNIANKIMLKLGNKLHPSTSLEFIPTSRLREWKQLQSMPNACLYNKVKNKERDKSALFNQYPITAFPANRLVVFKHPELPTDITLEEVIKEHNFVIGVAAGRSYGEHIDQFIASHPDDFLQLTGDTSAQRLHEMLFQNKLDAILEYTAVLKDRFRNDPRIDKVRFLSIDEESNAVLGYLACPRSEQGEINIATFDQVLSQTTMQDQIIKIHQQVFSEPERSLLISALKAKFNLPLD